MRLSTIEKPLFIAFFSTFLSLTALTAMAQEKWVVVRLTDSAVRLVDVDGSASAIEKLKIPSTLRAEDIASMTTADDEKIAPEEGREFLVVRASFRRAFPNCRTLVVSQKNPYVLDKLIESSFNEFPELEAFEVVDAPDLDLGAGLEIKPSQEIKYSDDSLDCYLPAPANQNAGLEVIDGALFAVAYSENNRMLIKYPPKRGIKRDASGAIIAPSEYVVPDSTTYIAPNAFRGCDSLKKIVLPKYLNLIGSFAFADCASLSEINFPEELQWIEPGAFWGCSSLTGEIVLPKSLRYVMNDPFSKAPVKGFVVPDDGEYLKTVDGVLFSKDMKRLICYPSGGATEYAIPETVETIEYRAFADCVALKKVAFPKGLKKIRAGAFAACEALSGELALPDGVTEIGDGAFANCSALSDVSVPADATIAPNAFEGTKIEAPVRRPVER